MTSLPTQPLGNTKLFQPIRVGKNVLSTRIAFAPSTRFRALDDHTVSDLQVEYYDDRSKFPGTLIGVEGTIPSVHAGFYARVPGIFHDDQIEGWRKINKKIHETAPFRPCSSGGWVVPLIQQKIRNTESSSRHLQPFTKFKITKWLQKRLETSWKPSPPRKWRN